MMTLASRSCPDVASCIKVTYEKLCLSSEQSSGIKMFLLYHWLLG